MAHKRSQNRRPDGPGEGPGSVALAGSDVGHIFPVTLVITGKVRAGVRRRRNRESGGCDGSDDSDPCDRRSDLSCRRLESRTEAHAVGRRREPGVSQGLGSVSYCNEDRSTIDQPACYHRRVPAAANMPWVRTVYELVSCNQLARRGAVASL
jgi:hypothetical protein